MRPGRLDKLMYVRLPDAAGRRAILRVHCRRAPLADDVDLDAIADDARAENFRCVCVRCSRSTASLKAMFFNETMNMFSVKTVIIFFVSNSSNML